VNVILLPKQILPDGLFVIDTFGVLFLAVTTSLIGALVALFTVWQVLFDVSVQVIASLLDGL
jgi:hypothetical protein